MNKLPNEISLQTMRNLDFETLLEYRTVSKRSRDIADFIIMDIYNDLFDTDEITSPAVMIRSIQSETMSRKNLSEIFMYVLKYPRYYKYFMNRIRNSDQNTLKKLSNTLNFSVDYGGGFEDIVTERLETTQNLANIVDPEQQNIGNMRSHWIYTVDNKTLILVSISNDKWGLILMDEYGTKQGQYINKHKIYPKNCIFDGVYFYWYMYNDRTYDYIQGKSIAPYFTVVEPVKITDGWSKTGGWKMDSTRPSSVMYDLSSLVWEKISPPSGYPIISRTPIRNSLPPPSSLPTRKELMTYTITTLKQIAKESGISGYSKYKLSQKGELVDLILL